MRKFMNVNTKAVVSEEEYNALLLREAAELWNSDDIAAEGFRQENKTFDEFFSWLIETNADTDYIEYLDEAVDGIRDLVGYEGDLTDVSNKLQAEGCEDICEFGNMKDLLEEGNMIVALDDCGDKHIQIYFVVPHGIADTEIEDITATTIKITAVEEV